MAYTVTFWGTRGSIPTPGAQTARYGGNTPCVAVEGTGGQLVILDAGTGIRALGVRLVERKNGAVKAEILLSHAHWDHIQGLPHFKPFFSPGNVVRIWGSRQGTMSLEAILRQQMDPAVFPGPLDDTAAPGDDAGLPADARARRPEHGVRDRQRAGRRRPLQHAAAVAPAVRRIPAGRGPAHSRRDVHAGGAGGPPRVGEFDVGRSGGAGSGSEGEAPGAIPSRARARRRDAGSAVGRGAQGSAEARRTRRSAGG